MAKATGFAAMAVQSNIKNELKKDSVPRLTQICAQTGPYKGSGSSPLLLHASPLHRRRSDQASTSNSNG
jgi:hypothetical protein